MINSFVIDSFRGIRDLHVNELNEINLIVGDNNSGKTSILEALLLLRNPSDFANVIKVTRARNSTPFEGMTASYENFICMFPHDGPTMEIGVSAVSDGEIVSCVLHGQQHRVLLDESELKDRFIRREIDRDMETDEFKGKLFYTNRGDSGEIDIRYNPFVSLSGTTISRRKAINIAYLSPCDHLSGSIINRIARSDRYKEICIKTLQLFDPDIIDMMILKSTIGNTPAEYLKHRRLGIMPLSTFGDGIKKVLVLANAIAQASGGILLIDEVEPSIHKKYFDDIFRFLTKSCEAFHVQLFITTHSIEAVDGLLATQDYNEQNEIDNINVITVKRLGNKSYSRVLSGREVAADREAFGFEVRL